MTALHIQHLRTDIDQYVSSTAEKMVDKSALRKEMVDKAHFGRETGRYFGLCGRQDRVHYRGHHPTFRLTVTTAKCYLRQLTEFGYLEAYGGNRNRSYKLK